MKIHPERIAQNVKMLVNDLNYDGVGFPAREKCFGKNETKHNICINVYCYENKLTFPNFISDLKFKNSIDLSLLMNENKSHYVYIKDFDRFMFHKTKNKNQKIFCKSFLQRFSSKNVLTEHREIRLSINGAQSVRLEKGTIKFQNYFKQIPVPFKIYADFEFNLKSVESYESSDSTKYQDHSPCSFAYKPVCVDNKFTKPIIVFRGENAAYEFIKRILKDYQYCKKVMKKYFNKSFIMSYEEEEQFQSSNMCWKCKKLIDDDDDEKVRDHCHITKV